MANLDYKMFDVQMGDINLQGIDLLVRKDTAQTDLKQAFENYSLVIQNNMVEASRDKDYNVSYDFSRMGDSWRSFVGYRNDSDQVIEGLQAFLIPKGKYRRFVFGPTSSPETDTKAMFEIVFENLGSPQCELFQYIFYRPNTMTSGTSGRADSVFAEVYVMLQKG